MIRPAVLILEKEPVIALELQHHLDKLGHDSIWTSDCRDALAWCREHWPDYALLNFHLEQGCDGMQMARVLRVEFGVQLLFLTAACPLEVERSPEWCPLHEVLYKPFTEVQLQRALREFLGGGHTLI